MNNPTPVIPHILEQHAEEAAFLWLQRDAAVYQPHYDLEDLAELDERVEAHLDGLRLAGEAGWEVAKEALSWEEPGEVFCAAMLAFESVNKQRIETVLEVGLGQAELFRGLISALGWMPFNQGNLLADLLEAPQAERRRLGIATCAVHRMNPGHYLDHAIVDKDISLRTRALRAVGELGRSDLLPQLRLQFQLDNEAARFWAAWSAALLGDRQHALEILKSFSLQPSPFQMRALQVLLRSLEVESSSNWLNVIGQNREWLRMVIIGIGIVGDPTPVAWLIQQMENPEMARVAGESFTFITGAALDDEDLEGDEPANFKAGPTENPEDEEVELDPDEDLPWPNPALVSAWWKQHQGRYRPKTRYLLGQPVTIKHCQQVLVTGLQRQRVAAALELALRQPGTPLFETRALGQRQQQWLKQK